MNVIINNKKIKLIDANNFYKKLIGLMFKKNINYSLRIKTNSIHTFFMKEKIDIIMLDKEQKLVYYEKNVSKNHIIIKKKAYYTIELPYNSLKNIQKIKKIIIKD